MHDNKHIKYIRDQLSLYGINVEYSGQTDEDYVRSLEERLAWAQYELELQEESIDVLNQELTACYTNLSTQSDYD